jgi:hypothetical protein
MPTPNLLQIQPIPPPLGHILSIDNKEVPSLVTFQYHTALKYARQKKLEILVKQGVNHPDIDEENLDEETLGRLTGWIHNNHLQTTN